MIPYEPFDGPYANKTDAKYLSLGLAQWRDENDPNAVSAKVWRYAKSSEKWSRMSEELPLHRVVDLCILIVTTLCKEDFAFAINTFENQDEAMVLKKLGDLPEGFDETKSRLRNRLGKLYQAMQEAGIEP